MSKSDVYENALLKLIFQAVDWANIADDAASSPITNLYISLHTGTAGDAGNQTTNEVTTGQYENYVRVAVARTAGGWDVVANSVSPAADITFAAAGAASTGTTITHFAIGTASTGTGVLLYHGAVTPNIAIAEGVTPKLTTASTVTEV